jgi:hypothetical protein
VPVIEKTATNAAVTTRSSRGPYKTVRRYAELPPVEDGSGRVHAIRHLHHGREQSQEATGMMNRDEDA